VYLRNPWLTYALVLHRFREHGFRVEVLDAIDERALTVHEIRDLCFFLFDVPTLPDPALDWDNFVKAIAACMARERPHWNPVTKTVMPWINLALLNAMYGRPSMPSMFPGSQQGAPPFQQQQPQQSYHYQQHQHQQPPFQQQPGPPPSQQQQAQAPQQRVPASSTSNDLVKAVEQTWAKQPPSFATTKPIVELLGTVGGTFALVESPHSYFESKFHPFSKQALQSGGFDVVKRAVRKMRFFLHPDRLPKDLNEQQKLLCRTLWDSISEAWELYESSHTR